MTRLVVMLALLGACRAPGGSVRGPGGDPDSADTQPEDSGDDRVLADVSHEREFRAVWVATVANIDFPSRQDLAAAEQEAELRSILDTMVEARLNAIVFQVRPESDALYASELEPWSRFLTGAQGQDPGYDPLRTLIDEAHARGIEVHAWLNPYRAKSSAGTAAVEPHVSLRYPEHAHVYGPYLWMDPGAVEVEDHVVAVVADIVERYDVDGIHFDDYFYPYPDGTEFPDDATYAAYVDGGGDMARADWRRANVNRLVRRVSEAVAEKDPSVRFGISPFGIYRPGQPEGIVGLDQYATIYADPVEWTEQGWLDYLAPQLYWPSTQTAQAYGPLIEWWSDLPQDGQYTFAGNFLSQLGSSSAWTVDEFRTQLALSRAQADAGSLGNIYFTVAPLRTNRDGIRDVFRDEFYPAVVSTPPVIAVRDIEVDAPYVAVDGTTIRLDHPDAATVRSWGLYRSHEDGWELERLVPADETSLAVEAGSWAVSAVGRGGVESRGVVVEVP